MEGDKGLGKLGRWAVAGTLSVLVVLMLFPALGYAESNVLMDADLLFTFEHSPFLEGPPISPISFDSSTNDTSLPTWQKQIQSLSNPEEGDTVLLYARLKDDVAISQAILSTDELGYWTNWTGRYESPAHSHGTKSEWAVFSWRNPAIKNGTTVSWKIWFNDSAGNWNVTGIMSFTVRAKEVYVVNLTHNTTLVVCHPDYLKPECGPSYYKKISLALDDANEDDTIEVHDGIYTENITIDKYNITIIGVGDPPVIDGMGNPVAVRFKRDAEHSRFLNLTVINSSFGVQVDTNNTIVGDVVASDLKGPAYGVYLSYANNNTVENVNASNNNVGIYIDPSENNTIKGNTIRSNRVGIGVSGSSHNAISNNTVVSNDYGISAGGSNNTISHNRFLFNGWGIDVGGKNNKFVANNISKGGLGIYLLHVPGATFLNNTLELNQIGLLNVDSHSLTLRGNKLNNTFLNLYLFPHTVSRPILPHLDHTIDTSNLVDGKPVYYLKNKENEVYDASTNAGFFACLSCENITVKGLKLSKNLPTMFLWNTTHSFIENNEFSKGELEGLSIRDSKNNRVINNSFFLHLAIGGTSNTEIRENRFNPGSIRIGSIPVENATIDHNVMNQGGIEIIYTNWPKNVSMTNNRITSSSVLGIRISSCDKCLIANNNITNGRGMRVEHLVDTTIAGNRLTDTGMGIEIWDTQENLKVVDNEFTRNSIGLFLAHVDSAIIANNTVKGNGVGIWGRAAITNTRIEGTTSMDNYGSAIRWQNSWNVVIDSLNSTNDTYGVLLMRTLNVTVQNSQFHNNEVGIGTADSYGSSLTKNELHNNHDGIIVSPEVSQWPYFTPTHINITSNRIHNNKNNGIYIRDSNTIYLKDNIINSNYIGINVSNSIDTYIYHNNLVNNSLQAVDDGTNIWDNDYPGGGNYWSDFDSRAEGCYDLNSDGICDYSYVINASTGAKDNYPVASYDGWLNIISDTSPPHITIASPQNATYTNTTIELNVSADETIREWWYSFNSGPNTTFIPNTTISGMGGRNELVVYATDTVGNVNSSVVYFAVILPVRNIDTGLYYTTIQEAVTAANPGDTIQVKPGNYIDNVDVSKPLNIYGSGKDFTIVNATDPGGIVFYVHADGVNISGFTARGGSSGVYLRSTKFCNISQNRMTSNNFGINLWGMELDPSSRNVIENNDVNSNKNNGIWADHSDDNTIRKNNLDSNGVGMGFDYSNYNEIVDNNITSSGGGLYLDNSNNNRLRGNNASLNSQAGFYLRDSHNNTISKNILSSSRQWGLFSWGSAGNLIVENNVILNEVCGIELFNSSGNRVYHNNIMDNSVQAKEDNSNIWDNGYSSGGNYWSDWTSPDLNGDGVVDYPRLINGTNKDSYPVITPDGWLNILPDVSLPSVVISSPENTSYVELTIDLNVWADETIYEWRYSLNSGTNTTFVPNTTLSAIEGSNSLVVYAEDAVGNVGSTKVFFTVDTTIVGIFRQDITTTKSNGDYTAEVDGRSTTDTFIELSSGDKSVNGSITVTKHNATPIGTNPELNLGMGEASLDKFIKIDESESLKEASDNVKWALVKIYYTQAELDASNLSEDSLSLLWYNESTGGWRKLNATTMGWVFGTGIDTTDVETYSGYVWANLSHLSVFTVVGISDITPPVITILSPLPQNYSYIQNITLNFTASDEKSGIVYLTADLDGTPVSNGQLIEFFDFELDEHVLVVTATDNAGNINMSPVTFTVIDDVPPEITITGPEEKEYLTIEDATVKFNANDERSEVAYALADLDGALVENNETIDLASLELGGHTLTVRAADIWGNEAESSVTFTIAPTPVTIKVTSTVKNIKEDNNFDFVVHVSSEHELSSLANETTATFEEGYTTLAVLYDSDKDSINLKVDVGTLESGDYLFTLTAIGNIKLKSNVYAVKVFIPGEKGKGKALGKDKDESKGRPIVQYNPGKSKGWNPGRAKGDTSRAGENIEAAPQHGPGTHGKAGEHGKGNPALGEGNKGGNKGGNGNNGGGNKGNDGNGNHGKSGK